MYKIAKKNLPQLYRRIAEKKELYLPLEIGGQTNFAVWEEGDTVALDVLKTVKSPKDAFSRRARISIPASARERRFLSSRRR